jgi:hypothetical protein
MTATQGMSPIDPLRKSNGLYCCDAHGRLVARMYYGELKCLSATADPGEMIGRFLNSYGHLVIFSALVH